MKNENIIIKIKKLLALGKSTNENEAHNAILKAQSLMAKNKITELDVESYTNTNIKIEDFKTKEKFRGNSWKSNLAGVIADNFSCFLYFNTGNRKVHTVCFYGKEDDVIICNIMFDYALKCINSEGDKLVKKMKQDRRRKHFDGMKNDYALGFISGLREKFSEQKRKNSDWALVLQKDQLVIDSFNDFTKGFKSISVNTKFKKHLNAYKLGKDDGKKFDISDKIENEGNEDYLV